MLSPAPRPGNPGGVAISRSDVYTKNCKIVYTLYMKLQKIVYKLYAKSHKIVYMVYARKMEQDNDRHGIAPAQAQVFPDD